MPPLEFQVLGPLRVIADGRVFAIAGARQRTLLACLLLHAGKVVPADTLIEAAWPDGAVRQSGGPLPMTVSRLRRQLGPQIAALLSSSGEGYVLDVDPGSVDLFRFEQAEREGQAALGARLWAQAVEHFRAALSLWRDEPLVDVPSGALHADVAHLAETCFRVQIGCLESELMLGSRTDLSAQIREPAAQRPFDERAHALLMHALYREGRVSDALEVYRDFRARTVDELGLEPGQVLSAMHGAILAADPVLDPETAVPPAQLPAAIPDFVGRRGPFDDLVSMLVPSGPGGSESGGSEPAAAEAAAARIAVVCGPGGVGKSTVALHAAHHVRGRFPGGALYADLRGSTRSAEDPAAVLADFLHALGIDGPAVPAGVDARAGLFRSITARTPVLVVLDDGADSRQVRPLLPGPGGAAVVTGRSRLAGLSGSRTVELGELPGPEAVALLAAIVGDERVRAEPEAAAAVAEACGRLPLAVRIAGARLAARPAWPVSRLARLLDDDRHRLDELDFDDVGVRACLEQSHAGLDGGAARALRLLSIPQAPGIDAPTAAALLNLTEREAGRVLESLVDAHLLGSPEPGRYTLHELTRLYARELCQRTDSDLERADALHAATLVIAARARRRLPATRPPDWTRESAADCAQGSAPDGRADSDGAEKHAGQPLHTGTADGLAWAAACRADLVAYVTQASQTPRIPVRLPAELVELLTRVFIINGLWSDLDRCGRAVLAAAVREGHVAAESSARRAVGWAALYAGDLAAADAEFTSARHGAVASGDRSGVAASDLGLGALRGRQGNHRVALEHHLRAAADFAELGVIGNAAVARNYLGQHHLALGEPRAALEQLEAGLALAHSADDDVVVSMALYLISAAHTALGEPERAIEYTLRALAIARARKARYSEARALDLLAKALVGAGRAEEAREHAAESARLFAVLGGTALL